MQRARTQIATNGRTGSRSELVSRARRNPNTIVSADERAAPIPSPSTSPRRPSITHRAATATYAATYAATSIDCGTSTRGSLKSRWRMAK